MVDRIFLFSAPVEIGPDGIPSPISRNAIPSGFVHRESSAFGPDRLDRYELERIS